MKLSHKEIGFMISHIKKYELTVYQTAPWTTFETSICTELFWLQKLIDNHEYIMVKTQKSGDKYAYWDFQIVFGF